MKPLLDSFVAVADEVGRLQRGGDAECELFRGFCEQGHYGGRTEPTSTRQGIYAIAPSGRFLASCNTQDGRKLAATLEQALAKWRELPEAERRLPPERLRELEAVQRFEAKRPDDGLVLALYVRDLGREARADDWRTLAWNEDQAWFTKDEATAFVPAATEPGAATDVPRKLVERLVRLHLLDTVRGQTPSFPRGTVREAALRAEVVRVEGDRVHLRLAGRTDAVQQGKWVIRDRSEPVDHERGVKTELSGRAVWDRAAARFLAFELLALGERWGGTQYNQRADDTAPTRIGFALVQAPADHPRTAPAFWWEYERR